MAAASGRISILTFEQAEQEDRAYWRSQSALERLRHQEHLRELNYGTEILNQGLQRILAVSELS